MNRPRLVAAIVTILTLVGALAIAFTVNGNDRAEDALALPSTTSTSEIDLAAIVESGVSPTLPEKERRLTDEAVARATSTTSTATATTSTTKLTISTTTTTLGTTPPPVATPSTAPPQTTPSTTAAPTTSPPTTSPGGYVSGDESEFASRINALRGSEGLTGLSRDGSLDSYARNWAKQMAESGGLSHSNLSSLLPPWSAAGENVGVGSSVDSIFDALVASSGHLENMLGDFTHMGIGVYQDSNGSLWTAHVFTR